MHQGSVPQRTVGVPKKKTDNNREKKKKRDKKNRVMYGNKNEDGNGETNEEERDENVDGSGGNRVTAKVEGEGMTVAMVERA